MTLTFSIISRSLRLSSRRRYEVVSSLALWSDKQKLIDVLVLAAEYFLVTIPYIDLPHQATSSTLVSRHVVLVVTGEADSTLNDRFRNRISPSHGSTLSILDSRHSFSRSTAEPEGGQPASSEEKGGNWMCWIWMMLDLTRKEKRTRVCRSAERMREEWRWSSDDARK